MPAWTPASQEHRKGTQVHGCQESKLEHTREGEEGRHGEQHSRHAIRPTHIDGRHAAAINGAQGGGWCGWGWGTAARGWPRPASEEQPTRGAAATRVQRKAAQGASPKPRAGARSRAEGRPARRGRIQPRSTARARRSPRRNSRRRRTGEPRAEQGGTGRGGSSGMEARKSARDQIRLAAAILGAGAASPAVPPATAM